MMHTDFPTNHELIVNPELPGAGEWNMPEIYVPQGFVPKPNSDHLILKLEIEGQKQIWHLDTGVNSEVWSTPDPDRILIDSIEGALSISLKDPQDIIKIDLYSLRVTAVKEHGLLLLNDYFSVLALDSAGIRWHTPALFSDDMVIESTDGDKIICSGISLSNYEATVKVTLDINTGKIFY